MLCEKRKIIHNHVRPKRKNKRDIIGKVGTSGPADENGNIDGKYDAHLHISFKGEHYKKLSVCNPFHNESKKSPNKKGILYEN